MLDVNMTELNGEDTLTKLNTQLNKSMVLMDNTMESEMYQTKSSKSIKINTKIQPASTPNASPNMPRRSILKKADKVNDSMNDVDEKNLENKKKSTPRKYNRKSSVDASVIIRPNNLEDFMQEEAVTVETTSSTFTLDNLSDDEDIWLMEIPRTINPQELKGQTLVLGDKSKFKIKEERYCAVNQVTNGSVTCVFHSGKVKSKYKTVNMKPAGVIAVRRKRSGIPKISPLEMEHCSVPFPKNLRIRHPIFGVNHEGKPKERKIKRSS